MIITICDPLYINHPFTPKGKFWVRPKIAAKSARSQYLVNVMGIIYGVLATFWRITKRNSVSSSRSDGATWCRFRVRIKNVET